MMTTSKEKTLISNDDNKDISILSSDSTLSQSELIKLRYDSKLSLSQRLRPTKLEDYIGQLQLVGEKGSIIHYFENNNLEKIRSIIFWGPPGVGKTSLAKIILKKINLKTFEISGSIDSISKIKSIVNKLNLNSSYKNPEKIVLFIDEIHKFNKSQQDYLLDLIDRNLITLIGATTENPSFKLIKPLLSRCLTLTLVPHTLNQIEKILSKGIIELNKTRKCITNYPEIQFDNDALNYLAKKSNGDLRNALKLLELTFLLYTNLNNHNNESIVINEEKLIERFQVYNGGSQLINYDMKGDNHYDTISAFHKSVRGNDINASLYYMMRMLKGGDDPLYIMRRIIRIASEDIGIIDNSVLNFCCQVYETVLRLGMPNCLKLLVECVLRISDSKKSIEIYRSWKLAKEVVKNNPDLKIPFHLRANDSDFYNKLDKKDGFFYKNNLNYKNGKVYQDYLPENLKNEKILLNRHLGTQVDKRNKESDSEDDFIDDDFYKKRKLENLQ